MSNPGSRPTYNGAFEETLFNRVTGRHAPNIPLARSAPPRDAATPEEKEALVDFYTWSAAHDLFIVQLAARAVDRLFRDDPDFQLVLSRQIGDDGAHAWASRDRLAAISGRDEIARIEKAVAGHWDRVGDIAGGSWQGFLAWELHYEHHILPKVLIRRRTSQVADLPFRSFAEDRIVPDEQFHRIKITEWWLRKFDAAASAEREEWVAEILRADEALQNILNPYLRDSWALLERSSRIDTRNHVAIYDDFRREILSYHLDIPLASLPALTSLEPRHAARAA
jgi:hypothetical protein